MARYLTPRCAPSSIMPTSNRSSTLTKQSFASAEHPAVAGEISNSGCWLLAVVAIASAADLTVRVNFPTNDQLMTWSAAAPPDNMREIWSTWEKAHTGLKKALDDQRLRVVLNRLVN